MDNNVATASIFLTAHPQRGQASTRRPASLFQTSGNPESTRNPGEDEEPGPIDTVIPVPTRSDQEADAPLLDSMRRMRDDPKALEEFIKSRPSEVKPTDEAFKRMPVETFGRALLAGMGHREGENEVKPYLLEGRPTLLGLGARANQQTDPKKGRGGKRIMLAVGCLGQIVGTHAFAVVCQVDGVPGMDQIRVRRLSPDARKEDFGLEELVVPRSQFTMMDDITKLAPDHPGRRVLDAYQKFTEEEARKAEEAFHRGSKRAKSSDRTTLWVTEGLRVMLTDDRDEATYKTKGVVIEVDEESGKCRVRLDKGGDSITIKAKYLQTVVPNEVGSRMLVVGKRSPHRGEVVKLLVKDKRAGICKAQVVSSNAVIETDLDDVCEFTM